MNTSQFEVKVLDIIERATTSRQNVESHIVELKRDWPKDIAKTAKLIAGHANAARGEPIIWIIGVDERSFSVSGADHAELSTWYSQISSHFDGLAPGIILNPNIPFGSKYVTALLFDTSRAPFVVFKDKSSGSRDLEVPWREANGTRTARREELLKILVRAEQRPEIEALAWDVQEIHDANPRIAFHLQLYIVPRSDRRVAFPFHKSKVELRVSGEDSWLPFGAVRLLPSRSVHQRSSRGSSLTVHEGSSELLVEGPGMVAVIADRRLEKPSGLMNSEMELRVTIGSVSETEAIAWETKFRPKEGDEQAKNNLIHWGAHWRQSSIF